MVRRLVGGAVEFGHNRLPAFQDRVEVAAVLPCQTLDFRQAGLDVSETVGGRLDVGGTGTQGPSQFVEGRIDHAPGFQIGSKRRVEARQLLHLTPDRGQHRNDRVILLVQCGVGAAGECLQFLCVGQTIALDQELAVLTRPRRYVVNLGQGEL